MCKMCCPRDCCWKIFVTRNICALVVVSKVEFEIENYYTINLLVKYGRKVYFLTFEFTREN